MDAGHWRAVQEVLDAVLDAPAEERPRLLDRLTHDNAELRAEVEELLELEDEAATFLDGPVMPLPATSLIGQRIGPYRIESLLGRGGMGAVYRASRVDDYELQVALKRVAPSVMGHSALRRFHAERQILARLDHPNIARLLDGGTDPTGQPYLVMEYVDGTPLDRWCDDRRLGIDERLGLFRQVADAVAYAHRNLVVHRDLKPANVLVTERGTVKLLDFGIAKLLEADGSPPVSALTRSTDRPMTPLWASPEQITGAPITTASDVYSLGLLLHQTLTGRLPGDPEGRSVPEIARLVCEVDATRPSALVLRDGVRLPNHTGESILVRPVAEDLAYRRGVDTRQLSRRLRGDLDAIVLQALRKRPHERYPTVERLIEDIGFHVEGRPVRARGDALTYHAKTLIRRHWRGLLAALVLLVIGTSLGVREVARLDAERRQAREVAEFLKGLIAIADPDADALSADRILDRARDQLDSLDADAELGAELADVLAGIYRKRGRYDAARLLLERSVELARRGYDPSLPSRLNNLAAVYVDQGAYADAGRLLRDSLDILDERGDGASALAVVTANNLATVSLYLGELDAAEALYRRGLDRRLETEGPESPGVATSLRALAAVHHARGDFADAETLLRRALAIRRLAFGDDHTSVASVLDLLGSVLLAAGERDMAEPLFHRALDIRRRRLGDDHLHVARTRRHLAAVLLAGEPTDEELATAGILLDRAVETLSRETPEHDWRRADVESLLGALWFAEGRSDWAEPCLRGGYERLRAVRGDHAVQTQDARRRLDAWIEHQRASPRD